MLPPIFAEKRKGMLIAIVVSALMQSALAVVVAVQMRHIFAAFHSQSQPPLTSLIIVFVSGVGIALLRVGELAIGDMLAHNYVKLLRVKLFNHISRLSPADLQQFRQGSLQIRFVGDLSAIQSWVGRAIPSVIAASFLLPILLYVLFLLHPYMALLGFIMASICILLMAYCAPALKRHHKSVRNKRGQLANYVASRISISPVLRVMGLRRDLSKRIENRSESLQQAAVKKSVCINSFKSLPDVFLQALVVACILLAFYLGMRAPEAAMILAIVGICHQPLRNVANFWDKRNAYLVSRRKCRQFLAMKSVSKGTKFRIGNNDPVSIVCRKVANEFTSFPDFTLEKNQSLLIHGPSGSGKSSLLDLLVGLSSPTRGSLTLNDQPITRLTDTSRQRLFYYLGNDVPIFASTLKQTLTLGLRKKVSNPALESALETFQLTSLTLRLGGLDGQILEQGKNLSEGEIKRIACCRAFLSQSQFILIDDLDGLASATDSDTVMQLINKDSSAVVACTRQAKDWQHAFSQMMGLQNEEISACQKITALAS